MTGAPTQYNVMRFESDQSGKALDAGPGMEQEQLPVIIQRSIFIRGLGIRI